MSDVVIKVENLSKEYRLGTVSHGTLAQDLQSWWARMRGQEDPNSIISASQPCTTHNAPHTGSENPHFLALDDVSFDVKQGEVLGIIGRNGAGKSTLLKILSEITAPTEGVVKMKGRVASLLEVGTGFHPELTGRDNVYLNGAILGMAKGEIGRKFDEIVAFAEIEQFIDTPVKRYSSGMYVRLAFAVAAHLEPEIMIVDEVLAVGDAAFQKKCLGKMGEVAKEGRTVLFVSHNMQAIRQLCSRALVLHAGKLVTDADSSSAIAEYLKDGVKAENLQSLQEVIKNLPADPALRIERITLTQAGRAIYQNVENDKELELEIHYQVYERTVGLRVYLDLCDDQDLLLLRSFHDEASQGIPTVERGHYISRAIIPANLLGPIRYELRFRATIFNVRSCTPDAGIRVPLKVELTGNYNRAYLSDTFRGKFALSMQWVTERTSQSD